MADVLTELQDVSGLDGLEQDSVAPVVVGGGRYRDVAIRGRLGAKAPEPLIHQGEAIEAELAGQRLPPTISPAAA